MSSHELRIVENQVVKQKLSPSISSFISAGAMIIYRMAKNRMNPLSHLNATLAPQARQAMASGENLNYVTLAPSMYKQGKQGQVMKF